MALTACPHFKFTEAISLVVNCETQTKDAFWRSSPRADRKGNAGLKDKYGLSWQIVPPPGRVDERSDPEKSKRVMTAMLKMKKLDISD